MFTWVCPSCGKEWDVAVKECADCAAAKRDRPQAALPQPRSDLRFWLLLGAAALIGIVAVVSLVRYQARRPPREATPARVVLEQPSAPKNPEPVPESASNAPGSDIEVAGIRMSYDSQDKPQVRAVVINHSAEEMLNVNLAVTLRPAQAAPDSPPLARFTLKVSPGIKPGESREVKAPLEALATLAAMPSWQKLRADVERR